MALTLLFVDEQKSPLKPVTYNQSIFTIAEAEQLIQARKPRTIPPVEKRSEEQNDVYCYKVLTAKSNEQVMQLIKQFEANSKVLFTAISEAIDVIGYWVMVPDTANLADARSLLEQMKQRDVEDVAIIGIGPHYGSVSLGLYSTAAAANNRLQKVQKLLPDNYHVVIVERPSSVEKKGFIAEVVPDSAESFSQWLNETLVSGNLFYQTRVAANSGCKNVWENVAITQTPSE